MNTHLFESKNLKTCCLAALLLALLEPTPFDSLELTDNDIGWKNVPRSG
jgi:hypothetical protein